jgi:sugar O-acyltransferase (sialic acid O-acetyltransferase NeuD family)
MASSPQKVIIIGGLGNGSVVAAAIDDAAVQGYDEWSVEGYLNDRMAKGGDLEGHSVLGKLSDVQQFIDQGYHFIYTIYRIDGQDMRIALFESLQIPDDRLATFIHPKAYVAGNVEIGPGSVVMPNASVSPGTRLGRSCLVMTGAVIGHNSEVGDYCHFAAQCCLGAYSKVGKGVHIGINASVRENLTLGDRSTLAMGGVLLSDMEADEIWSGIPAAFMRRAGKELT